MATATRTKLQNFIGGEFVDPATGQTVEGEPSDGRGDRRVAELARRGRRPRRRRRPRHSKEGPATTPASARSRCSSSLTRSRSTPSSSPSSRRDAGKPSKAVHGDEIPSMVDNLRFFAGAARASRARPPASTSRATRR